MYHRLAGRGKGQEFLAFSAGINAQMTYLPLTDSSFHAFLFRFAKSSYSSPYYTTYLGFHLKFDLADRIASVTTACYRFYSSIPITTLFHHTPGWLAYSVLLPPESHRLSLDGLFKVSSGQVSLDYPACPRAQITMATSHMTFSDILEGVAREDIKGPKREHVRHKVSSCPLLHSFHAGDAIFIPSCA